MSGMTGRQPPKWIWTSFTASYKWIRIVPEQYERQEALNMRLREEIRSPKTCEANCPNASDRIWIQAGYSQKNLPQVFIAVLFVFAPVVLMPVVALVGYLAYCHLRLMGATNVKKLDHFLHDRKSHRYT